MSKRLIIRYIISIFCAVTFISCQKNNEFREYFLDTTYELVLQINGQTLLSFDADSCQTSSSTDKLEFKVFNDNISEYYIVSLNKVPGGTGSDVKGSISWTTDTDVSRKSGIEFEVVKQDGEYYWLWSRRKATGVVIRVKKSVQ